MKKITKISLLGTLLTTSALAITLPIVSCSASAVEDEVITPPVEEDYSTNNDLVDKFIPIETNLVDKETSHINIARKIQDILTRKNQWEYRTYIENIRNKDLLKGHKIYNLVVNNIKLLGIENPMEVVESVKIWGGNVAVGVGGGSHNVERISAPLFEIKLKDGWCSPELKLDDYLVMFVDNDID